MLQLRPVCEHCAKPLPPASLEARICSYECTFCAGCVERGAGQHLPELRRRLRAPPGAAGARLEGRQLPRAPIRRRHQVRHRPVDAAVHQHAAHRYRQPATRASVRGGAEAIDTRVTLAPSASAATMRRKERPRCPFPRRSAGRLPARLQPGDGAGCLRASRLRPGAAVRQGDRLGAEAGADLDRPSRAVGRRSGRGHAEGDQVLAGLEGHTSRPTRWASDQTSELLAEAVKHRGAVGWTILQDKPVGLSVGIPTQAHQVHRRPGRSTAACALRLRRRRSAIRWASATATSPAATSAPSTPGHAEVIFGQAGSTKQERRFRPVRARKTAARTTFRRPAATPASRLRASP